MAKIIENHIGRRMIRLSSDDILMVVQQYQEISRNKTLNFFKAKNILEDSLIYLPEEV